VRGACGRLIVIGAALSLAPRAAAQASHVVIVTGIGGGAEYAARFHASASAMAAAARSGGVPDGNIAYLAGDSAPGIARSTKANVERALGDALRRAGADDLVFVLLIGHGSHEGAESRLNLPGPDITAAGISSLLAGARSRRVVVVNAASGSGDFVAALAAPGRTIVTATKSSAERNETLFAQHFVAAFAGAGADTDKDGKTSVLEAFEYARREVARAYAADNRLLTEHAVLEDGADGAVARSLHLGAPAPAASSADPAMARLLEQKRDVETRLAALRRRKDTMPATEYDAQLERLLVELAEKDAAIRGGSRTP